MDTKNAWLLLFLGFTWGLLVGCEIARRAYRDTCRSLREAIAAFDRRAALSVLSGTTHPEPDA